MARIFIGLALYDGAEYLWPQLRSIAAQDLTDWRLVVSDDGSRDEGPEIVREFAADYPHGQVSLQNGPGRGATQNFLSLLASAGPDEYVAFADQDDVWKVDKLSRARGALQQCPAAGLYSARTTITDANLRPLGEAKRFAGPFNFRNALVQAVTGGNTCVLTPKAAELARQASAPAIAAGIEAHDWWLYQIVSGAGMRVLRDDAEVLYYRQHGENLKGRNDTLAAMRSRVGQLFAGEYGDWVLANVAALKGAEQLLSRENRGLLAEFDHALHLPGPQMAWKFARLGLRRQTFAGTLALYSAVIAGRISGRWRQPG